MLTNTAAWLGAKQAKLEVKPAPYMPPRDDEIIVKNHAVAVNPVDWEMLIIRTCWRQNATKTLQIP